MALSQAQMEAAYKILQTFLEYGIRIIIRQPFACSSQILPPCQRDVSSSLSVIIAN
jgi:hypothetical protein